MKKIIMISLFLFTALFKVFCADDRNIVIGNDTYGDQVICSASFFPDTSSYIIMALMADDSSVSAFLTTEDMHEMKSIMLQCKQLLATSIEKKMYIDKMYQLSCTVLVATNTTNGIKWGKEYVVMSFAFTSDSDKFCMLGTFTSKTFDESFTRIVGFPVIVFENSNAEEFMDMIINLEGD